METKKRRKPVQNFKYEKVLNEDGKLYYIKKCVHCKNQYKTIRQTTVFCCVRCRKASAWARERVG